MTCPFCKLIVEGTWLCETTHAGITASGRDSGAGEFPSPSMCGQNRDGRDGRGPMTQAPQRDRVATKVRAPPHCSHPRCAPRVVVAIATDERLMSREARVRGCKRGVELDGPAVQLHGALLPLATEVAAARTSWALRCRSQPRRFAVGYRAIRQRAVARRSAGSSSAPT